MKNDADSRLFGFYHTTIIIVKLDRAQRLEYFYEERTAAANFCSSTCGILYCQVTKKYNYGGHIMVKSIGYRYLLNRRAGGEGKNNQFLPKNWFNLLYIYEQELEAQ